MSRPIMAWACNGISVLSSHQCAFATPSDSPPRRVYVAIAPSRDSKPVMMAASPRVMAATIFVRSSPGMPVAARRPFAPMKTSVRPETTTVATMQPAPIPSALSNARAIPVSTATASPAQRQTRTVMASPIHRTTAPIPRMRIRPHRTTTAPVMRATTTTMTTVATTMTIPTTPIRPSAAIQM